MEIGGIEDLKPDPKNANRGTERGLAILEDSLSKYGAGRSILVDRDGVVIAGNKTLERAADLVFPVRIVKTNGRELIVVQREDLDLDGEDGRARELAYADNRSSQVGLDWDVERILADVEAGVDLSGLWRDWELETLAYDEDFPNDPYSEWQGMPEFEREALAYRTIHIHFKTDADIQDFARMIGQIITDKTRNLWYPAQQKRDIKSQEYMTDES